MLAKLGQLLKTKSAPQKQMPEKCIPNLSNYSNNQNAESFYSITSNNSRFYDSTDNNKEASNSSLPSDQQQQLSANLYEVPRNYFHSLSPQKQNQSSSNKKMTWKIGDSLDVIYEQSKIINQTIMSKEIKKKQVQDKEPKFNAVKPFQQILDVGKLDISGIPVNDLLKKQSEGNSVSILKEIQSINGQQYNAKNMKNMKQVQKVQYKTCTKQEMDEMHHKMQLLQNQQKQLEKALSMATNMLKISKQRNQSLQKELNIQKQVNQQKQVKEEDRFQKVKIIHGYLQRAESRIFPQFTRNSKINTKGKLRNIYRQCAISPLVTLFQNRAYRIQISYKNFSIIENGHQKQLTSISLDLCPNISLIELRRYKFAIKFIHDQQISKQKYLELSQDHYKYQDIFQEFIFEESFKHNSQYIYKALVYQYDSATRQTNKWQLLVPVPITWFIYPRLSTFSKRDDCQNDKISVRYSNKLVNMLSSYKIQMKTLAKYYQILKKQWWVSCTENQQFFSVSGSLQILGFHISTSFSIEEGSPQQQIDIEFKVFGKRNGVKLTAFIEFVSFFLSV